MHGTQALGYLCILLSSVGVGSCWGFMKLRLILVPQLNLLLFQLYAALAICFTFLLTIIALPMNASYVHDGEMTARISPLAMLSGLLQVLVWISLLIATERIEVVEAVGVMTIVAMSMSYLWGTVLLHEWPRISWMAVIGLLLMIAAVLMLIYSNQVASLMFSTRSIYINRKRVIFNSIGEENDITAREVSETKELKAEDEETDPQPANQLKQTFLPSYYEVDDRNEYMVGLFYSILSGVFASLLLLPMQFVSRSERGLVYLPTFGFASALLSMLLCAVYYSIMHYELPYFHVKSSLPFAMGTGMVWAIGIIFIVPAIDRLGYTIAIPLLYSSVIVPGIWGMCLLNEYQAVPHSSSVYFASCLVLVTGIVLLAVGQ